MKYQRRYEGRGEWWLLRKRFLLVQQNGCINQKMNGLSGTFSSPLKRLFLSLSLELVSDRHDSVLRSPLIQSTICGGNKVHRGRESLLQETSHALFPIVSSQAPSLKYIIKYMNAYRKCSTR